MESKEGVEIDLQNVTFRFIGDEGPTLDNISLTIQQHERLCIAGYNRSGKNTLLHLLTGFYTDFEGSISYNGIPSRNLDLGSLHRNIGEYTLQTFKIACRYANRWF